LGRRIAAGIPQEGARPDLVELLPQKGIHTKHLHYFHNDACLNSYYFLADENLFDLDSDTEAVIARYRPDVPDTSTVGETHVLMIIRYPSRRRARKAVAHFMKAYLPEADRDAAAQTENGKWMGVRRKGALVVAVFDASSREAADKIMNAVPLSARRR